MAKSLIHSLKESGKSFVKNPLIFLPSLIAMLILSILSELSTKFNSIIGNSNSFLVTGWFVLFSAICLLMLSYFFAGLIGLCFASIKGKIKSSDFFSNANKYWLKNFIIIIVMVIFFDILQLVSVYGAYFIGKSLSLSLGSAKLLLFFIYFAGLIGWLIFFTFANFFLIERGFGLMGSIKKSFSFVKLHYIEVLVLSVGFFIILQITTYLDSIAVFNLIKLGELLATIIVYPYLALILAFFLYGNTEKER